MNSSRRCLLIGAGKRGQFYIDAIENVYWRQAQVVAILEPNAGRLEHAVSKFRRHSKTKNPALAGHPKDLERIARGTRADCAIISSPDNSHAELIQRCLHSDLNVIVEKPLTIDSSGVRQIAVAARDSARRVTVVHNYRYTPRNSLLKQIVMSGEIGQPLSVTFEWLLDTVHGADYFRRWHREKANSGGLLVHKASHHFDLVNWILEDFPITVFAAGGLKFYGKTNAAARRLDENLTRGTHDGPRTPWELDLRDDIELSKLYLDSEAYDGYLRDQSVFGSGISTEDNLSAIVQYSKGAVLTYSMNAHSPWEGYRLSINGTEGRVELNVVERSAVLADEGGRPVIDAAARHSSYRRDGVEILIQRHWQEARRVPVVQVQGGHGGGDKLLLDDLFDPSDSDSLHRRCSWKEGAWSVAIGIAGNESLRTGLPVNIKDLYLDTLT